MDDIVKTDHIRNAFAKLRSAITGIDKANFGWLYCRRGLNNIITILILIIEEIADSFPELIQIVAWDWDMSFSGFV